MILIAVVPILLVLLVIRSARVRSQEKQQLLNEQAQGILGSGFGGTTAGPSFVGPFFFSFSACVWGGLCCYSRVLCFGGKKSILDEAKQPSASCVRRATQQTTTTTTSREK